jgi:MAGUK p55 subfamily protein 5
MSTHTESTGRRRLVLLDLWLLLQSLKAIRNSDLMPYIVFVSPPSLQQLKRQKELLGQYNIKDDDLKAVLGEGKRIEQV